MDQVTVTAVQSYLQEGDRCIMCIDAGLIQDWVKSGRILALIEHSGDYGFLVLLSTKFPVVSTDDLTVDRALPVNDTFKCEIDSSTSDVSAEDNVYLKITSNKQKLLFELPYTAKAKSFVNQLSKSSEAFALKMGPPSDFQWLMRYNLIPVFHETHFFDNTAYDTLETRSASAALSFEDNFSDMCTLQNSSFLTLTSAHSDSDLTRPQLLSPEFGNIPRQSIAMGVTPLAARESAVKLQMTMHEDDYIDLQTYTVLMGTWNVNGQSPKESLSEWLAIDPKPPDFYVIGFQELDLSKEAYVFTDTPKEDEWLEAVRKGLNPTVAYTKVKLIRLIGMMIIVFVKEELVKHIHNVAAETVGTGLMGVLGNKGGVAVRLDFHNTSICFVNCHLAAFVDECERRNQDYNDICTRITFNQFKPPKFIKDHDHIYWMGDMNYRIMDFDADQVKAHLAKGNYAVLLQNDQLGVQRGQKKVFVGFSEEVIAFPPTYKYDMGTNNWDSSEKNRAPAWCDRVLWKGDNIKNIAYRSHSKLLHSDHRPVSALFESKMKVVNTVKYRKIHEEVMKKLDKLENEFLPQVTVDKTEVAFGQVYFIESVVHTIIIGNNGQVPAKCVFMNKFNDTKCCKDWLTITPSVALIKPGESCSVDLELLVDKNIAYKLNSGKEKIYDILVLHLEGGKDLFITVTGTYEPSCFGSSLEALVRIPIPMTEVPPSKLIDLENHAVNNFLDDKPPHFEIPKEIWVLVDHLYKFGLTQEYLFQQPGLRSDIIQIRKKLDNGYCELDQCNIHSVAEAFLLFLEALAEPVIPYEFYYKCLDCSNNFVSCKSVINGIPKIHKHVFRYLIAFLRELVNHAPANKLDAKILATIFGVILLREPSTPAQQSNFYRRTNQQAIERKKATFIFHFLMNDLDD